jgi:ParB family transcriptional regulator, chromosome partitioning protein
VDAHVAKTIAAKPKLVQISTAYGLQKEGSATLPRNKYTEIRPDKPTTKEQATRPEFKTCKHTTDAIVSEGIDKGELCKVCTEPTCPVHHPKSRSQKVADDPKWKAEQKKQRRETAIANTTGIRTLAAIIAAVPVRLMKRDLLFVAERLASLLDEKHLAIVAKQYGIRKAKESDSLGKLFAAYLRRAEEACWAKCWWKPPSFIWPPGIIPRRCFTMPSLSIRWTPTPSLSRSSRSSPPRRRRSREENRCEVPTQSREEGEGCLAFGLA